MIFKIILPTILLSFCLNSCSKERFLPPSTENPIVDTIPQPTYDGLLKVVWQRALMVDSVLNPSFTPIVFNNNIIFSNHTGFNNPDEGERLIMFDGTNGNKLWEWEDYIGRGSAAHFTSISIIENDLIYNNGKELYSINLEHGNTNWNFIIQNGCASNLLSTFGHYIFSEHEPCALDSDISHLVMTSASLANWDTIYTKIKDSDKIPSLSPPGFWINPQGDTVLLFQNRSFSPWGGQIDMIAYNLSKGKEEFQIIDMATGGNSNVRPPVIWNDKAYFAGTWEIFCIDMFSGDILWKFDQGQFMTCNLLIAEDKLIVNSDHSDLYALNPLTGEVVWHEPTSGASSTDMVYHDGMVYFTSWGHSVICAVDIKTGEHIWREKTPNKVLGFPEAAFGKSGVAINPDLGYLYVMDDFFAMCIELPER